MLHGGLCDMDTILGADTNLTDYRGYGLLYSHRVHQDYTATIYAMEHPLHYVHIQIHIKLGIKTAQVVCDHPLP